MGVHDPEAVYLAVMTTPQAHRRREEDGSAASDLEFSPQATQPMLPRRPPN